MKIVHNKEKIRIDGERIYLRKLIEDDASEEYASWINNRDVNKYLETKKAKVEELRDYIKKKSESKNCLFFGIFSKENDKHIGNIKLEPIDFNKKIATMGMLIGNKNYWGKGIGTEALKLLVNFAFEHLKIEKIDLGVLRDNKAAIRVYEKAGFNIVNENKKGFKMVIEKVRLSRLCLGTVQLGMNYGINNLDGKPSFDEAKKIIGTALINGINSFDTSPHYGDSEKILGKCLDKKNKDVVIISKVPPTDWRKTNEEILKNIDASLKKSLKNLKIEKIPIYLIHRFDDLEKENGLVMDKLLKLKAENKIGKIGISIYTPLEAEKSLENKKIEVIQIPFNLIDKRLRDNGFLNRAKEKGVTILARSVFLQGLFFKKEIPESLKEFRLYQKQIKEISKIFNIEISELALRYVLSINQINNILIGVEKEKQLTENINIYNKGKLSDKIITKIDNMGNAPEKIINPGLWVVNKGVSKK
jgi:aryl-alcohol dehydrogenase-like predicted oxidoreductase/RimJ/RimL family protein N-acetyltransferase